MSLRLVQFIEELRDVEEYIDPTELMYYVNDLLKKLERKHDKRLFVLFLNPQVVDDGGHMRR